MNTKKSYKIIGRKDDIAYLILSVDSSLKPIFLGDDYDRSPTCIYHICDNTVIVRRDISPPIEIYGRAESIGEVVLAIEKSINLKLEEAK